MKGTMFKINDVTKIPRSSYKVTNYSNLIPNKNYKSAFKDVTVFQ
jgi:hypothetical protein